MPTISMFYGILIRMCGRVVARVCLSCIPLGMRLSVEECPSPSFSHPVRDASERGIPTGCHNLFALLSTERYIPSGMLLRSSFNANGVAYMGGTK